jgi:ATP-dependent exoDNAse (exonuclease V) beta subunit
MPLTVDAAGAAGAISSLAEAHGRVFGATAAEVDAARVAAEAAARHAVMREAAQADARGACYRETPVTWRLEDGTLVEGNVDLAYLTGDEVVIVDFKTDRELEGSLDRYRRQVQVYAAAVGTSMGRPSRGVILKV